jgi:hypothetical protein
VTFKYLFIVSSVVLLQACNIEASSNSDNSTPVVVQEKNMSDNANNILDTEDKNDPRSQVPIKAAQLAFITESIKAAIRVVSGEASLTDIDSIFGVGKNIEPKGPGAKLVRFYSKEVEGKKMGIDFTRRENNAIWYQANLGEAPRNSPKGVYKMDLPSSFFNGMILDRAFTTKPSGPNDLTKPVNVFEFHTTQNKIGIKLIFEARPDVSNLDDKYPQSFSNVEISRLAPM